MSMYRFNTEDLLYNRVKTYPKKHFLRILKKSWAKYDFEGFYGVLLKKNHYWTDKYLDW